jgi:hypothetical protein
MVSLAGLQTVQSNGTFQSKFHTLQTTAELYLKMKHWAPTKHQCLFTKLTCHIPEMQYEIQISHMLNSKDPNSRVLNVGILIKNTFNPLTPNDL